MSRPFAVLLVMVASATLAKGSAEIVLPPYLDGYGYSLSLIGLVTSLISGMQLVSRLPVGVAYRAGSAKRQYALALIAFGLSTTGFAFALGEPLPVAVLSLIHGFAFGTLGTVGLALAIDITGGRRAGSAMALYTMSLSAGYALGALAGGGLADTVGIPGALAAAGLFPVVAAAALVLIPRPADVVPASVEKGIRGLFRLGAKLDIRVWLAFATVIYLNVIQDAIDTFFPVFAPTIGLSLASVGFLRAAKSGAAILIRFSAAVVLHVIDYRWFTLVSVVAAAIAMFVLPLSASLVVLVPAFVVIGLTRGILRATSAATVAELRSRGQEVGLASGVYNAGLDIGGIIGPAIGGVVASAFGIGAMFQIVAVASLLLWLAVAISTPSTRVAAGLAWPPRESETLRAP